MTPKLRFNTFPDGWNVKKISEIMQYNLIPVGKPTTAYVRLGLRSHAKGVFHETVKDPNTVDMDTLFQVEKENFIINITFAWEHAVAITSEADEGTLVSHRFPTFSFKSGHLPFFYKQLILHPSFKYQLWKASPGGAGRNKVLNKTDFLNINMVVPTLPEQKKSLIFFPLWMKKSIINKLCYRRWKSKEKDSCKKSLAKISALKT